MTPERKLELYVERERLLDEDEKYLLSLFAEVEEQTRGACATAARRAAERWPENAHVRAVLNSLAAEIMEKKARSASAPDLAAPALRANDSP